MNSSSELILNPKGHVYHLDLSKDMVAPVCITVGDPDRVSHVSKYFDHIDIRQSHREFVTHVGRINQKPIMVISTGISTDNIDIVFNELDALVNIDLHTGQPLDHKSQLQFIRIGTTGALDPDIPVNSILINPIAFGLDSLMRFYPEAVRYPDETWINALNVLQRELFFGAYVGHADQSLLQAFGKDTYAGIAITCPGFYGPQGRSLRLKSLYDQSLFQNLFTLEYQGYRFSNFEMETAGIYGLASALGHRAVSLNIVLANRANGTFSADANEAVDDGIALLMNKISDWI